MQALLLSKGDDLRRVHPVTRWLACAHLQGQYDRVHCGAACPPAKLGCLLELLRPEGGLIVTPVEPSDLRVITKGPDGAVRQRVISQVRYSTLEVRVLEDLGFRVSEPPCLFWQRPIPP